MDGSNGELLAETNLRLDEIDRGFLLAQINEHLAQCINDISDLNKEPTKKRAVQVTIEFHPSKSRKEAAVTYNVTLKPSTHIAREPTTVFLGKNSQGELIAKPWVPDQPDLPGVHSALDVGHDGN